MLPNPIWYPEYQTPTVLIHQEEGRQLDRITMERTGQFANITQIEARFPGPPDRLNYFAKEIEELVQNYQKKWNKYEKQKEKAQRAKEEYAQAKQLLEYDQRNYNSNVQDLRNRMPEHWDHAQYIVNDWISEESRNLYNLKMKMEQEDRKEKHLGAEAQQSTEFFIDGANACLYNMARMGKDYQLFKADWQDYIGWVKGNLEIWEQRCSNPNQHPQDRIANDHQRQAWRRKFQEVVEKLHLLKRYIANIQQKIVYFSERYGLQLDFGGIWRNQEELERALRWDTIY